jgi:hypothetical protein
MPSLEIKDLSEDVERDREALKAISGGMSRRALNVRLAAFHLMRAQKRGESKLVPGSVKGKYWR